MKRASVSYRTTSGSLIYVNLESVKEMRDRRGQKKIYLKN